MTKVSLNANGRVLETTFILHTVVKVMEQVTQDATMSGWTLDGD